MKAVCEYIFLKELGESQWKLTPENLLKQSASSALCSLSVDVRRILVLRYEKIDTTTNCVIAMNSPVQQTQRLRLTKESHQNGGSVL